MSFEDPSFREEDSFKMAGDFNRMEHSMGRHMIQEVDESANSPI